MPITLPLIHRGYSKISKNKFLGPFTALDMQQSAWAFSQYADTTLSINDYIVNTNLSGSEIGILTTPIKSGDFIILHGKIRIAVMEIQDVGGVYYYTVINRFVHKRLHYKIEVRQSPHHYSYGIILLGKSILAKKVPLQQYTATIYPTTINIPLPSNR